MQEMGRESEISSPFTTEDLSKQVLQLFNSTSDQKSLVRLFFTYCLWTRGSISLQDWTPVPVDVAVTSGVATMPTALSGGSWLTPFAIPAFTLLDLLRRSAAEPRLARHYHGQRPFLLGSDSPDCSLTHSVGHLKP